MSDYPEPTWWNGSDDREDVCTDDPLTCECPECRAWRETHEPEPDTFDEALATKVDRAS